MVHPNWLWLSISFNFPLNRLSFDLRKAVEDLEGVMKELVGLHPVEEVVKEMRRISLVVKKRLNHNE